MKLLYFYEIVYFYGQFLGISVLLQREKAGMGNGCPPSCFLREQRDNVLATALQLVDEQVLYPIQELLGTWWAIITKKEWRPNPVDDPHAMYCSAFVRYCYEEAGVDFIGPEVNTSNTTPEHVAQAGIKAGKFARYNP